MLPLLHLFKDPRSKARYLDAVASMDARLSSVAARAQWLSAGGTADRGALARRVHQFVRDAIRYVRDEGGEEFADSSVILARGYDDCDGKARLFVALCRRLGLQARIRPVFSSPRDFVHVQAEVRWPGSEREPLAEDGGWMLSELILEGCDLGVDPDAMPRDARGGRIFR